MEGRPLEKIYQKKTQLEHILLRPDSYIGSTESREETVWLLSEDEKSIEQKRIEYCPGLYKIFDEVLVNAADNYQRDHRMSKIEVDVSESGRIRVLNDGKSIPIAVHKEHKVYVAELIFGHLLTSSNYEDDVKKIVGGRNGYGAKLANIFSKQFEVRTGDASCRKQLTISWTNNMTEMDGPHIESYNGTDFTCVEFTPDFKRFGLRSISSDMVQLLKKRVYDMAGILKVKVFLNGVEIKLRSFNQYVDMYMGEGADQKISESEPRWKVVLVPTSEGQFQQVSFVNSICTYKGGAHVNYIMDQVVAAVQVALKKKHKDMEVKPAQIKGFFFLFLSCSIENPAFDSQTKENMTTKVANFGSEFTVSEKMIKEVLKSNVIDRIVSMIRAKDHQKLSKQLKKKKGNRLIIPKLEDANLAGKGQCTLILTEGDSAKSLAMAGIQRLGRDHYGVFPLKGKLLNVNELTAKQMMDNEELKSLIRIIGLELGKEYTNTNSLRYTSVMIMADQDNDGSHIKGLILNFFHSYWPSLCRLPGFLKQFVTPIVRCRKGEMTLDFFSVPDYEAWHNNNDPGWRIKYYKGLGTSTSKEAEEYFSNLPKHEITFLFRSNEDSAALDMAFNKKSSDVRKVWLSTYNPEVSVDYNKKKLTVKDFVHQELIHFSSADNVRSIPSLVDGLKPSQRKILYSCFKRNLRSEIKVAQLAGYVAEHSSYHHGEAALCMTIVSMAQNYVGSNNLNLLMPIGQFGTRSMGGKDAASARYIYTNLNPLTRLLFPEADDHIVEYQEDEGLSIEPKYYYPILPLVLINGADGIGTGWSTCIHPFKVKDVIQMVRSMMKGKLEQSLIGWEGFKGTIEQSTKGGYIMRGVHTVDDHTVAITELPVKKWTRDYKSFLQEKLETSENKQTAELEQLREYHLQDSIEFVLTYLEGKLPRGDLEKELKLVANLQNSNMVLFDSQTRIKKYEDVASILREFYQTRMGAYAKRKQYLVSKYERELQIVQMKVRFIRDVMTGSFKLEGKREQWVRRLQQMKFLRYSELASVRSTKKSLQQTEDNDKKDYDYILNLPIWSFTTEKIQELEDLERRLRNQLQTHQDATPLSMWMQDIDAFEDAWDLLKQPEANRKSPSKRPNSTNAAKAKPVSKPEKKVKRKKKQQSSEQEDQEADMSMSEQEQPAPKPSKKRFVEQQNKDVRVVETVEPVRKDIINKRAQKTAPNNIEIDSDDELKDRPKRRVRQEEPDQDCYVVATPSKSPVDSTKRSKIAQKWSDKIQKKAADASKRDTHTVEVAQIAKPPVAQKPPVFKPVQEAQSLLDKYLVKVPKPAAANQPIHELSLAERLMLKLQDNKQHFEESVARQLESSDKKQQVKAVESDGDLF